MPITSTQRTRRKTHIGSSDAPAIAGLSPFRTAGDVYLEKTADIFEQQEGEVQKIGRLLEHSVLNWFQEHTHNKIRKNQRRVHSNMIMAANIDAIVEGKKELVEAKTSGVIFPAGRDQWGEEGTDQIPEHVIVQCQHSLAVEKDYELVWVPVLLGGVGFRLYRVDRNDELIEKLEGIEVNFWNEYVLKRTPPPDSVPSVELLKRLRREPNKVVPIDPSLVLAWQDAKSLEKNAKDIAKKHEAAVLNALGDAESGISEAGEVTYLEQTRKEYVAKASTFRVLRLKKTKELVEA